MGTTVQIAGPPGVQKPAKVFANDEIVEEPGRFQFSEHVPWHGNRQCQK